MATTPRTLATTLVAGTIGAVSFLPWWEDACWPGIYPSAAMDFGWVTGWDLPHVPVFVFAALTSALVWASRKRRVPGMPATAALTAAAALAWAVWAYVQVLLRYEQDMRPTCWMGLAVSASLVLLPSVAGLLRTTGRATRSWRLLWVGTLLVALAPPLFVMPHEPAQASDPHPLPALGSG